MSLPSILYSKQLNAQHHSCLPSAQHVRSNSTTRAKQ